jgi:hypothetical protein
MFDGAMQKMLMGVIASMGIDANVVMGKLVETQQYVVQWIQHFDRKFQQNDENFLAMSEKLDAVINYIQKQEAAKVVEAEVPRQDNSTEVQYTEKVD